MGNISLPKNIKIVKTKEKNSAIVEIGPCFPGYGITLGNALRRVLLSSLSGAAPVGIAIEGVEHEFMTLAHLKEDILEFVLNLKKLRLKVHSDEVVKLELKIHGKKEITAADISKNSQIEIVNPDLVLGHITDMSGGMQAEIYAQNGMGYETIESRESKEKKVSYIEMDAIYSPITHVGINVENARVGKMTNWDKLILDIATDGTISPGEAFEQAVGILVEQFGSLAKKDKKEKKQKAKEKKKDEQDDETDKEEKKDKK
jgi:DNA-directed RNA polymerase subunit alpha